MNHEHQHRSNSRWPIRSPSWMRVIFALTACAFTSNKYGGMRRVALRRDKKKNQHREGCSHMRVCARAPYRTGSQTSEWMRITSRSRDAFNLMKTSKRVAFSFCCLFYFSFVFFFVGFGIHMTRVSEAHRIRMAVVVSTSLFSVQSFFAGNISRTQHKCVPRA